MNKQEQKYVADLEEKIESLEEELEDFHAFTDGANETEKQVRFIMVAHSKAKSEKVFFDRLKELYLEGEINEAAYDIANQLYESPIKKLGIKVDSKPIKNKAKAPVTVSSDPCGLGSRTVTTRC